MAVEKINYENKLEFQNDPNVPNKNKVTDENMNEIKSKVNNNADELIEAQQNIEDLGQEKSAMSENITNLKNRVITLETDNVTNKSDISEAKQEIINLQESQTTQDNEINQIKGTLANKETEIAKSLHIEDAEGFGRLSILGNHEQNGEPSEENPIEIKCLGDNKKNLFSLDNKLENIEINFQGIIASSDEYDTYYIEVEEGEEYTFSTKYDNDYYKTAIISWGYFDEIPEIGEEAYFDKRTNLEELAEVGFKDGFSAMKKYLLISILKSVTPHLYNTQLEKGTVSTSYVPYGQGSTEIKVENSDKTQELTYVLPIQQEMLKGDYFLKELDIWKEVHNWQKIDSYNGESITTDYISTTGSLTTGATVFYKLQTPKKIPCTEEQSKILNQLNALDLFESVNDITTTENIALLQLKYASNVNEVDILKQEIEDLETNKVDKVEGKGLSTEDFTTELKTKLEGLENYNDTEVKADITELEGKVSTLETDNTTNKTNIESLQEDNTQNKADISDLQESQEEQNSDIEALTNALPTETQEGENINIKGTIPTKFKEFVVGGNSKQETREGYNLLNVSEELEVSIFKEITVNLKANSTYTLKFENAIAGADNNQSLITFRNTADVISRVIDTSTTKEITVQPEQDITNIRIYASTDYTSSTGKTKTFEKLMLYEGTDDKEYEQYGAMPSPEYPSKIQNVSTVNLVGGKWTKGLYNVNGSLGNTNGVYVCFKKFLKAGNYVYSYNADIITARYVNLTTKTNLNIHVGNKTFTLEEDAEVSLGFRKSDSSNWDLGENLEDIEFQLEEGTVATEYKPNGINITVCNKNRLNLQNVKHQNNCNVNINENGLEVNPTNEYNPYFFINCDLEAGTYYLHLNRPVNSFNIVFYGKDNISLIGNKYNSEVITLQEKCTSIRVNTGVGDGNYTLNYENFYINKGDKDLGYIEHQEKIVNFPLAQGQKLMLGDYLATDGIHHKRKQIELDGTENWQKRSNTNNTFQFIISETSQNGICNNYKSIKSSQIDKEDGIYLLYTNAIIITDFRFTTVADFKNHLSTKKEANEPVVIEYELTEEEIEAYTEEQKEAYNQLINLKAYEEETNVYSTNSTSPIFKVTAVQSTNAMLTKMKQLILEGGN